MTRPHYRLNRLLAPLVLVSSAALGSQSTYPIQDTPLTGGEGSVEQHDHNAFSLPQSNLSITKRLDFSVGNSFFRNPWVVAPASTDARDGLVPCSTRTHARAAISKTVAAMHRHPLMSRRYHFFYGWQCRPILNAMQKYSSATDFCLRQFTAASYKHRLSLA